MELLTTVRWTQWTRGMGREFFTSPMVRQSTKDFLKKEKWQKGKFSTCRKVVSARSKVLSVAVNGTRVSTERDKRSMKEFLRTRPWMVSLKSLGKVVSSTMAWYKTINCTEKELWFLAMETLLRLKAPGTTTTSSRANFLPLYTDPPPRTIIRKLEI